MVHDRLALFRVVLGRFIIITVILVVNAALFGLGRVPVYVLAAVTYVLTIGYSVSLLAGIQEAWFCHLQIVADLIIATLLIHFTGGIDSVLNVLYPLISIAAAMLISPRAALVTAFLGAAVHAGMVSLEHFASLPWLALRMQHQPHESPYVFSLLYLRVTIFSIIGVMAAYLLDQSTAPHSRRGTQETRDREDRLQAIGRLAASTAHEIRNPLASISGCVEALQTTMPHDEQSERLFKLILKETSRLNNIIGGLLEFGKPRQLKPEIVSPAELAEEVITLLRSGKEVPPGIEIQNLALHTRFRAPCDPEQFKQVVFNLLKNALQAITGQGVITLTERTLLADNRYEFAVRDSGAGMDAERVAGLFQPFSSGKAHGVGLGLAIAQSIVQEHGGAITVESRPGQGAVFRVHLPLNRELGNQNERKR